MEWPLVKALKIAGSAFPVFAAMRDFHKTVAGFIEQWKSFGPVF